MVHAKVTLQWPLIGALGCRLSALDHRTTALPVPEEQQLRPEVYMLPSCQPATCPVAGLDMHAHQWRTCEERLIWLHGAHL